ncbi:unnamed protein product [Prorocentrum cordatum]|uniref:3'-phosphate/5'-hydroxy nucleic acid ligase n=1 Tax=Prorocentrum cordatum TaxID=2364126 RepID=A0ABN9S5P3_9DINO|nr:unnamed protein product [Polarella glacialis]
MPSLPLPRGVRCAATPPAPARSPPTPGPANAAQRPPGARGFLGAPLGAAAGRPWCLATAPVALAAGTSRRSRRRRLRRQAAALGAAACAGAAGAEVETLGWQAEQLPMQGPVGAVFVREVVEGGWAARLGVRQGDRVALINKRPPEQLTREELILAIRGRPVELAFERPEAPPAPGPPEGRPAPLRGGQGLPVRIETRGVPVLMYAPLEEVEEQARNQLISLAESPLPVGHVSAMPDVHMGKGVAIGAVFASEKYVCPNAVGVDIGCGMCAVPVSGLFKDDLSEETLRHIQGLLKRRIPVSMESHDTALAWASKTIQDITAECPPSQYLERRLHAERNGKLGKIHNQLGTLGGGNHFIEVVYSEGDQQVWCMLHSGSRNVGNTTAAHYDEIAGREGEFLQGVAGSLNYLEIESPSGQAYLKDMTWCQAYARENRRSMLDIMVESVEEVTGKRADMERAVNAHHNFCQCETCHVENPLTGQVEERKLWVTRKGATSAREGQYGIIPGSMGVGTLPRRPGPRRARLVAELLARRGAAHVADQGEEGHPAGSGEFEASMKGIVCDTNAAVRDEAPQAYKDLATVLAHQAELVEVEHRLLPLVNVKEEKGWGGKGGRTGRGPRTQQSGGPPRKAAKKGRGAQA